MNYFFIESLIGTRLPALKATTKASSKPNFLNFDWWAVAALKLGNCPEVY
ncbi:MAG: hypothetical protein IT219_08965, partial [Bacteroidales bacterium]|nr:hypothetical protein [Bacteroidales bacterium]